MSIHSRISLNHLSFFPALIMLTSSAWALSSAWTTFSSPSPTSPSSTLASAIVLCSSALLYYYHQYLQRNSHQYSRSTRSRSDKDTSSTIVLPEFISLEHLGRTTSAKVPEILTRRHSIISPPFLLSSSQSSVDNTVQQQPNASKSSPPLTADQEQQQQQQKKEKHSFQLDVIDQTELESVQVPLKHTSESNSNQTSTVEIIPKETLEALWTHPDYRIWDHIVVGEGYEALEPACRLAQQHPTRTILTLLEIDMKPNGVKRVVQWIQKILATLAQRLWTREALKAVPAMLHDGNSSNLPDSSLIGESPETTFQRTNSIDMSSLPCNICIGPRIHATKILIDKPITFQNISTSNPRPVRRFSSLEDQRSNLTINTSTSTPSRTIGLEIGYVKDSKDTRCQLFCKDSIVFVNDKHPLVQSLDVTKSPSTSRDGGPTGRRMSSQNSEDRSHFRRMVFSIRMQYRRTRESTTSIKQSNFTYYRLLTLSSLICNRMLGHRTEKQSTRTPDTNPVLELSPVLLHRSERVVHNGRVGDRQSDDDSNEVIRLQISASTTTLEALVPIQILVKAETQPIVQDTFGNTEMIRKGEAVLMEGLGLARQMAYTAGWTCLEEDDSQMVEWVRDQMSIQWSSEPQPSTFLPVCATLDGLQTFTRARTPSNSGLRVKTPKLSPYTSRTHSFTGKRREGLGISDKRDSTLKRLQEVTETLQAHEKEKLGDKDQSRAKVTIAAVEGATPQRPGLKTSFGGFSSLNNSRIQTLALAEGTEDHLGMSLSISPLAGSTILKEQTTPPQEQPSAFSDGIGPLDFLGMDANKPVSPKPKALSRFSIKSYQLERSNYGLKDEWGIGGKATNSTLGSTTANDVISTPPLIADVSLSGSVSPLTSSSESLPVTDFLQGLSPSKPYVSVSRFNFNRYSSSLGSGREEQSSSPPQDSHLIENGNKRKSVVGTFSNISSTSKCGIGAQISLERPQLEKPAEIVHDFLGESFGTSPVPSSKAKFERSYKTPDVSPSLPAELARVQSAPTNLGSTGTKTVQFAGIGQFDDDFDEGRLQVQRAHSEPAIATSAGSSSLLENTTDSSSNSSVSNSKSKAHTRRSWGQGIGGNDILGIQGLS